MNSKNAHESHEFAFYFPETAQLGMRTKIGALCAIEDRVLCHRLMHVLRLGAGATFVLFDAHKHMSCIMQSVNERTVQATVTAYECNTCYAPHITFLLPLLKREAFEESLYSLTELGVNVVQLVMTKKTQRSWGGQKESERIDRIIQAAAEQSKNFALPKVMAPVLLERAIESLPVDATKIFFDPAGCRIGEIVSSIQTSINTKLVLSVGPEGDLAADEKTYLDEQGFVFCQLTPTVLRAQQAVAVSVGALRSLMRL